MTKLLAKNDKIANSNTAQYSVFNFGIPAYKSRSGFVTCPMAGKCGQDGGCYAQQGAYIWSNVIPAYEFRLEATLRDTFRAEIGKEIRTKVKTADREGKIVVVRIHDSGDFYSPEYVQKWLDVMADFPQVKFYAYTKMVPLFQRLRKAGKLPENFTLIFSEGGIADRLIDTESERHSRVFESLEDLLAAGYADSTEDDLVAGLGENHRIGLVYHGAKAKAWTTAA